MTRTLCEGSADECSGTVCYRGSSGWQCDRHWQRLRASAHHARELAAEVRRQRPRARRDTD